MESSNTKEYMTFNSGGALFAVPIESVLSINGNTEEMHCKSFGKDAVLGVVEHLGVPVAVYDFSLATSKPSLMEQKAELIEILKQREQDHIDWLDSLEKAIVDDEEFTKARDPHKCAFGVWYDNFDTIDEDLQHIMADFDAPHKQIHSLADQLLSMKDQSENQKKKCLEILENERKTTLNKLRRLFDKAREQIAITIKPVLIYLTLDNESPHVALKVDEIADVEEVEQDKIVAYDEIGLPHFNSERKFVDAYMTLASGQDCLLIRPDRLLSATDKQAVAEAS